MQDIEQTAINTYQENIKYLEKNHSELFQKINILNIAIETNRYEERYVLEYKDNYFDILDTQSNSYFYTKDSLAHAKKIRNNISFKKNENSIETFYKMHFNDADTKTLDSLPLENNDYGSLASIVNYINKNDKNTDEMKSITKFIFFGTALGIHIPLVLEKIKSPYVLIIEDSLELFRLSLFTTNYASLHKDHTLTFSIQDDLTSFEECFSVFTTKGTLDNDYLKYFLLSEHYLDKIKIIQNFIISQDFLTYPFYKRLARDTFSPKYLSEKYNFIDFNKKTSINVFKSRPTIVIAAGPSIDKHIQWLHDNQKKLNIICVLAAAPTLVKNNIIPHIITSVDYTAESLDYLDNGVYEAIKDSIFLFASYVPAALINLFSKDNIFFFEQGVQYKKNGISLNAPSIGETSYALSLLFNSQDTYLLGLDLALNQLTGETHAKDHNSNSKSDFKEDLHLYSLFQSKITVKGNFIDEVITTPVLSLSIGAFKEISKSYKKDTQNVYNLSEGAYLEKSIPTCTKNVNLTSYDNIDFSNTIKELKKYFFTVSSHKPSSQDYKLLKNKIDEAIKIKSVLLIYEKIKITNLIDFSQSLTILIQNVTVQGDNKTDIRFLYTYYMRIVANKISSFFNTKNLPDEDKHSYEINEILKKQLLKIVNYYIDELEKNLKKY